MAMETQVSELMKEDIMNSNKILSDLLNPKNINMKTEISDPITFALLEAIISQLEDMLNGIKDNTKKQKLKLSITKKMLKKMIKCLKEFLVSWDRKSRTEITETLKSTREEGSGARSLFQKMADLV